MYLQADCPRAMVFFGFDWMFRLDEEQDYRAVQLPHDWSVDYPFDNNSPVCGSGGYVKAGIGHYKKIFKVSPQSKGKKIFLGFDGAYMSATVWLNGKVLGSHAYGYTPFEFNITDLLIYDGENELDVHIDNAQQPNSRWYSGSGITRDVWLRAVNPVHISTYGTFVRIGNDMDSNAEKCRVDMTTTVEMSNHSRHKSIKLITTLCDSEGIACAESQINIGEPGNFEAVLTIQNPRLWSHNTPYLYKAISVLKCEESGETLDEYETVFGLRSVQFDPDKGCLINGEQVKLNGVCLHHDGGAVGAAVPKKVWERRLMLLKEMGANAIRTAHNPPDTALLDLCDEMGFYVMDEAFDEWAQIKHKTAGSNTHESRGYSEWFECNHAADLESMVYRDRNHPSVIIWSIGNEVPEQTMADGHLLAQTLQELVHRIDPTRLCTQGNDQICAEPKPATDAFLDTLDIVGYNYTGRWRNRAETLYYDDKIANPNRLIIGTENPAAAGMRGDYRMDIPVSPWQRAYYAVPVYVGKLLRFTMSHDYVAGDFMWTGIDHLGESHWPHRSSSSGVLDTCGFKKDHFYFYKSIWRRDIPMVHIFPHRNLNERLGTVLPVLCYTNCTFVELFVNGKSYGKKATSYPLYGMTETYGHFNTPPVAANTDDLFLSWDVPFESGYIEAVGYIDGQAMCRHKVVSANEPVKLIAVSDTDTLQADGRDIAHIEVTFEDCQGVLNPVVDNVVQFSVAGPAALIGIDNGKPDCHVSFKGDAMPAYNGMLLGVLQASKEKGEVIVTCSSAGLEPAVVKIKLI
jgi:beta-galactosidase